MKMLDFILYTILDILSWLIVLRCLSSFISMIARSDFLFKINSALTAITDPILYPFSKILELIPFLSQIPVDFSPFLALLVISLLQFLL